MKSHTTARALIASVAALGFGLTQNARVASQQSGSAMRQMAALKNGQSTRQIEADHFGNYFGGIGRALMRDSGHTPREWGMSVACRRMVRKNRMHRIGIGHAKI